MNRILSNKELLISIFAVLGVIVLISIYFLITIILKYFVYPAPTATAARSICHTLPLTAHGHRPVKNEPV